MDIEDIYVTKALLPDYDEYCSLIKRIWDNHILTNNGPLHQELEQNLKKFCSTKNITLFTNGHLALETAIASLGLKGEIITTPFSFVSVDLISSNRPVSDAIFLMSMMRDFYNCS